MRAALGLLSLEEGLTALTAGTAATAVAALYCGIYGSDVFLILVGIFAFGVAGFSATARLTGQRKLFRVAQWLQWTNLALFFLVGVLLCCALGGSLHWAYAHPASHPARFAPLTGLLDLVASDDPAAPDADGKDDAEPAVVKEEKKKDEIWALGGNLGQSPHQCVFPFTFEEKSYEECASGVGPPPTGGAWEVEKDREHPWCMTDLETGKWGYCLSVGAWMTAAPARETVVHARVIVPHQAVVLLFVVLCQLVVSSFSVCVLEALETEETQERRFKDGWRGYGALDTHGPPAYAPGYATTYAPHVQARVQPRSQPPDAVFHPAVMPPR